jgi:hypothetical protein
MIKRYVLAVFVFSLIPIVIVVLGGLANGIHYRNWCIETFSFWLFGIAGGVVLVLIHVRASRLRLNEFKSVLNVTNVVRIDSIHLSQKAVIHDRLDVAFELCEESVSVLAGAQIVEMNRPEGKLRVRSAPSLSSLGELIEYRLVRIDAQFTEISISTRPAVKTTLVDYGKGLNNIMLICQFLRDRSKSLQIGELVSL